MDALNHWVHAVPALPAPDVQFWGWRLAWAVVLMAVLLGRLRGWPARRRQWLALAVLGGVLWSGSASPAHWLGLAFQSPSLFSAVWCAAYLLAPPRPAQPGHAGLRAPQAHGLVWLGVWWGWLLLGDTLAWWTPSLYAWGFSPLALLPVLAVVGLYFSGHERDERRTPVLLAVTLVLFVATRLPSGNLWDALLDPWLWLALHGRLLRDLWRRVRRQ